MKCLEKDSEKKFSRTEVPVGGVPVGTGFMAATSSTFTYLILVNYLSTADGVFDFSV